MLGNTKNGSLFAEKLKKRPNGDYSKNWVSVLIFTR